LERQVCRTRKFRFATIAIQQVYLSILTDDFG